MVELPTLFQISEQGSPLLLTDTEFEKVMLCPEQPIEKGLVFGGIRFGRCGFRIVSPRQPLDSVRICWLAGNWPLKASPRGAAVSHQCYTSLFENDEEDELCLSTSTNAKSVAGERKKLKAWTGRT